MKRTLIIIGILAVVLTGAFIGWRKQVKSKSPEKGADYVDGDSRVHVYYNGPFKKGRVIFAADGLVPYGKVWRTGANEATYLETNKPLMIKGQKLNPGKYSLWTIPDAQTWKVIFNSEYPSWGINFNGEANRNPQADVLTVEVPAVTQDTEIEQFTISLEKVDEEVELIFLWDKTLVSVPFTIGG